MLREEQVEIPVKHAFSGGMYSREIVIPKGTLLTGRIHKFDHFDVMISGDISVSTDDGEIKRLTGYHSFEGKAGKKRVGYAHEDTHWITFHSSPENNPDDMYHFLTCGTFEELEEFNVNFARLDYENMVAEIGMTEDEIMEQVNNNKDLYLGECESLGVVGESKISGKGYFTIGCVAENCIISKARIGGLRTDAGKFTNHSLDCNARMVIDENGDIDLVSIGKIEEDQEITINYRETLAHRAERGDLCQQ